MCKVETTSFFCWKKKMLQCSRMTIPFITVISALAETFHKRLTNWKPENCHTVTQDKTSVLKKELWTWGSSLLHPSGRRQWCAIGVLVTIMIVVLILFFALWCLWPLIPPLCSPTPPCQDEWTDTDGRGRSLLLPVQSLPFPHNQEKLVTGRGKLGFNPLLCF